MGKIHYFGWSFSFCCNDAFFVHSVSSNGFRLNNSMFVHGPMTIFPTCVLGWLVRGARDITVESMALFRLVSPKPDLVLVGVGSGLKDESVDVKR